MDGNAETRVVLIRGLQAERRAQAAAERLATLATERRVAERRTGERVHWRRRP